MLWWTLRKLKSADAETRLRAAEELGESANRGAVPALIEALVDESREVGRAAAESLARIVHPAAAEPLVKALHALASSPGAVKGGPEEFRALAIAIANQGKPSVAPLLRLLDVPEKDARLWSAHALGRIGDPESVPPLARLLDDKRSDVRREAALALGQTRGGAAVEPLVRALSHRDIETRRAAAEALGVVGGAKAEEALGRAVKDPDEAVQIAAVAALGQIGTFAAALALQPALDSDRRPVRDSAVKTLGSMSLSPTTSGERAALAALRADVDAAVREGDDAVPFLIQALGSRDGARRLAGARGLGRLRTVRALPDLLRAIKDRDSNVQAAAADALAEIGAPALEGLLQVLAAGDVTARRYAACAIGAIRDPRSVAALVEAYRDNHRASESYPEPLEAARTAMEALVSVLGADPTRIPPEDLELVSELPDGVLEFPAVTAEQTYHEEVRVDASALRDLARRGLAG
jgi:HEAT repeat protein